VIRYEVDVVTFGEEVNVPERHLSKVVVIADSRILILFAAKAADASGIFPG